ncbi:MAG: hypothetical protein ACM3O9_01715 [Methylocystaceae bacterium]
MARFYHGSLLITITVALFILIGGSLPAMATTTAVPYLGNMLLQQATGVEMVSTRINIKISGEQALITCDYQLVNRGSAQTVRVAYPVAKWQDHDLITGFAASKNSVPLPVKKQRSVQFGIPNDKNLSYNSFTFPLDQGETCTVRNSYFATLPSDATLGRLLHYDNQNSGAWNDTGLKKIDITIAGFKPYFNLMLFPEISLPPQKFDYNGNFSFLIDPNVNRQDIYLYYQLRGPEAAMERLTTSAHGQTLLQLIKRGHYGPATQQLQLLTNTLVTEGILSPTELNQLQVYLAYQQQDYILAAEALDRLPIKDGAYKYYLILNSLQLNQQTVAGQSLREIGQFEQQDLSGISIGLLKTWAEQTISHYLARPAAPVPSTTTAKPEQHTAIMLLTMGLVVVTSITITTLMRRTR